MSKSFKSQQSRRAPRRPGPLGDLHRLRSEVDVAFTKLEEGINIAGDNLSLSFKPSSYHAGTGTLAEHLKGLAKAFKGGGGHTHDNDNELCRVSEGGHDVRKDNPHATGFDNLVPRKLEDLNKVVDCGDLDLSTDSRTPKPHRLSDHTFCSLTELNLRIKGATLDSSSAPRPPKLHSHEAGSDNELAGDELAIAYTPQYYKVVCPKGKLEAHLRGIDASIGGGSKTRHELFPIGARVSPDGRAYAHIAAPSDLAKLQSLVLVAVPTKGGAEQNLDMSSCYAKAGETINHHTESDTTSLYDLGEAGIVVEIDIIRMFPALAGGDLGELVIHNKKVAGPILYMAVRMEYRT